MDPSFFEQDRTTGNLSDIFLQVPRNRNQPVVPPPVPAEPVVPSKECAVVSGDNDEDDEISSRLSGALEGGTAALHGSRNATGRLWTDKEEMTILRGLLDFKKQRGMARPFSLYSNDSFYEQVKKKLLKDFSENQLNTKLRRIKEKYRDISNVFVPINAFTFRNDRERDFFLISHKIWGSGTKRALEDGDDDPASTIQRVERKISGSSGRRPCTSEEERTPSPILTPGNTAEPLDNCLLKLFKEAAELAFTGTLVGGFMPGIDSGKFGMNLNSLQVETGNLLTDDKWLNQQILELEVYQKRIELIQNQVKSALEKLKSIIPSSGI